MICEQWLPIPGYSDYAVSNVGRVRRVTGGRGTRTGLLKLHQTGGRRKSYLQVSLRSNGRSRTWNVHQLVAITFLGDRREEGFTVDHLDENPRNNVVTNLAWVTPTRNFVRGAHKRWRKARASDPAPWE